ncbi:Low-density lipoprotein receptor domain class A [Dictyocaulus viviparus]|uniref:Low-density lipoprotein receptor domain class A n=1 Tax=Dictyocaulus viviparus TaxID=29172 RepID=A0A0D8Y079_DICVI|nr:Low-density lipoprotein receptor domain class A [Dictyocaulus viviparus]
MNLTMRFNNEAQNDDLRVLGYSYSERIPEFKGVVVKPLGSILCTFFFLIYKPSIEHKSLAKQDSRNTERMDCGIGQFSCDGRCLPLKWKCDGEPDCASGMDELSSCARCGSNEFRCHSGRCLSKIYLCDGTSDCGANGIDDNSDEDPSICRRLVFKKCLVRQIFTRVDMNTNVFICPNFVTESLTVAIIRMNILNAKIVNHLYALKYVEIYLMTFLNVIVTKASSQTEAIVIQVCV